MSIKITTTIFCNSCGEWLDMNDMEKPQRRELRKQAKDAGWLCAVRVPSNELEDYCPKCNNRVLTTETPEEANMKLIGG